MNIKLTNENYYSPETNKNYMSVSQFKDFAGTTGKTACEYAALAKYEKDTDDEPKTTALLVGSYIDSYFEGTLDDFTTANPEIYKYKNPAKGLKADFEHAEKIITRIERDPLFKQFMSGNKQEIMTGNMFGIDWKIKMDSYFPGDKIVDLKIMKDINPIWSDVTRSKMDFIHYWGYDIQGAIYQRIEELNSGRKLPFYIAVATKEDVPDIQIIQVSQEQLDNAFEFVREHIDRTILVKNKQIAPNQCGHCAKCKIDKVLTEPIQIEDIMPNYKTTNSGIAIPSDDTPTIKGYPLFGDM